MDCPRLSERLLKTASLVPPCGTFLDVGTDHAYLPVYLIKKGICKKAIASDVKKGPLDSAKKTAQAFDVLNLIDLRLGSGFETVAKGEADCAVVAGMGGKLISELLAASKDTARSIKRLILQPMTAVYELRKFLYENNYTIDSEILAKEDFKLYHILSVSPKPSPPLKDTELFMGTHLLSEENEYFAEYTARQINKLKKQIDGLKKSKSAQKQKILPEKEKFLEDIEKLLERKKPK